MAYSELLANRIRQKFSHLPSVEEKKMFGGIAFMVDGKMCVTVNSGRMMCRIDPKIHEEIVGKTGCSTMFMKGREYKGYIYVSEESLKTEADIEYWINLALDFNKVIDKKK